MGTRNVLGDAVLFATTTTGTGTLSVGSAVTGYFAPADVSPSLDGLRVGYVIVDSLTAPTIREVGEGVLATGAPWTLTRATIRRSLTGGVAGSSALNLSAGTKYVFITPLAANLVQADTDGWFHTAGDMVLATNGTERLRIEDDGTITPASAAAWRTGLAVPAIPTSSAGAGKWEHLIGTADADLVLPAGGNYAWWALRINTVTGAVFASSTAGGAGTAGGSTIAAGVSGSTWIAFYWREV